MPYKHIAAQLKKTELACRLHYHQLSFGNKSRRTASVTSIGSFERSSSTPARRETPQRRLPSFSPPTSPENNVDYTPIETSPSQQQQQQQQQSHKPILPKPILSPERAAQDNRSLRLVTADMEHFRGREYVDMARLDRIYDTHRLHFWSTIARSYGCNLSPATLEEAWRYAHGMTGSNFPPTPKGSPQSSQAPPSIFTTPYSALTDPGKGFTPINNAVGPLPKRMAVRQSSFAISSLLTEDKEVRRESRQGKEAP